MNIGETLKNLRKQNGLKQAEVALYLGVDQSLLAKIESNERIELKNAAMMGKLLDELKATGFTDEEIDKICYKNVLRVFKENFK